MAYSPQLKRVLARIEALPNAVRDDLKPSLIKSATDVADMVQHLAETSRDTGALIDSVAVTLPGQTTPPYSQPGGSRTAHELEAIVTVGNSDVRYAHLVEYGTAEAPAQPFFWPAVRTLRKRINGRLKRAAGKAARDWWSRR